MYLLQIFWTIWERHETLAVIPNAPNGTGVSNAYKIMSKKMNGMDVESDL